MPGNGFKKNILQLPLILNLIRVRLKKDGIKAITGGNYEHVIIILSLKKEKQ